MPLRRQPSIVYNIFTASILQGESMFTEQIHKGFYILAAVSGVFAAAFAASFWFA